MKKVIVLLFCIVLLITTIFAGCNQKEDDVNANTTVTETTWVTAENTKENSTSQTEQQSNAEKSETDNKETSQNSTTEKTTVKATDKTTSKKQTTTTKSANRTTKKVTTTKKTTTTKKATTTKMSRCTNNNNHSMSCGDMGRWFTSRSELFDYYMSVSDSWTSKFDRGEIDYDTMVDNCPMGYECWSCAYCGKWTGNFKFA